MKDGWLLALLACAVLANSAYAQSERSPRAVVVGTLPTHRVEADLGPGCRIAAIVPVSEVAGLWGNPEEGRGGLGVRPTPKHWRSGIDSLGFALTCRNRSDLENQQPSGVYDAIAKRWMKDPKRRLSELKSGDDAYFKKFARAIVAAGRTYDIKTPNAHGWADTDDDMTGDDSTRLRRMGFCVYYGEKALCGSGNVAYLINGQRGDLTPHALKIIRSIEFLD